MSTLKNLGVGEMIVCSTPTVVTTILGSCVSVVLFSEKAGKGGIIHYALPDRTHAQNSNRNDLNFGDSAIRKLYDEVCGLPLVEKRDLRAKIIGGGSVIDDVTHSSSIGSLNVETARNSLRSLGIQVVGENTGGMEGRKIYFYSESGRVRVSKIETQNRLKDTSKIEAEKRKIRVLVVDDSKTIRDILTKILSSQNIEIMGTAASAEDAEIFLRTNRPDVITLDINMPGMDGVTFLQKYLSRYPIPTVMISSINIHESDQVLKALELGAVDYIQKPTLQEITSQSDFIREKIVTASTIKVMARNLTLKKSYSSGIISGGSDKLIAIGASTGGTEAIKEVLMSLPANIPPIVIVQHIPPVFSSAFAKRLNDLCAFEVKEGVDGDKVVPGKVIIAPGGMQMELVRTAEGYKVRVFDGERVNRHKPSVDVLFNSVAKEVGKNAVGVILTGMGEDGAAGLLKMKQAGAYTIGQDEESSVVYGMPRAAALLGAIHHVCSLRKVSAAIITTLEKGKAA